MKRLCERVACEDGRANWGDIIAGGNRVDLEGEGGVMHPYLDEGIDGQRLSTHSCFSVVNPRILSSRSNDGAIVVTLWVKLVLYRRHAAEDIEGASLLQKEREATQARERLQGRYADMVRALPPDFDPADHSAFTFRRSPSGLAQPRTRTARTATRSRR
jgi:hypothetical protein